MSAIHAYLHLASAAAAAAAAAAGGGTTHSALCSCRGSVFHSAASVAIAFSMSLKHARTFDRR